VLPCPGEVDDLLAHIGIIGLRPNPDQVGDAAYADDFVKSGFRCEPLIAPIDSTAQGDPTVQNLHLDPVFGNLHAPLESLRHGASELVVGVPEAIGWYSPELVRPYHCELAWIRWVSIIVGAHFAPADVACFDVGQLLIKKSAYHATKSMEAESARLPRVSSRLGPIGGKYLRRNDTGTSIWGVTIAEDNSAFRSSSPRRVS